MPACYSDACCANDIAAADAKLQDKVLRVWLEPWRSSLSGTRDFTDVSRQGLLLLLSEPLY